MLLLWTKETEEKTSGEKMAIEQLRSRLEMGQDF